MRGSLRITRANAMRCFSPPAQAVAAFAHHGLIFLRQVGNEVVDIGGLGRFNDLVLGGVRPREQQVGIYAVVEQIGFLCDHPNLVAE